MEPGFKLTRHLGSAGLTKGVQRLRLPAATETSDTQREKIAFCQQRFFNPASIDSR